jgi:hypothetical protein
MHDSVIDSILLYSIVECNKHDMVLYSITIRVSCFENVHQLTKWFVNQGEIDSSINKMIHP